MLLQTTIHLDHANVSTVCWFLVTDAPSCGKHDPPISRGQKLFIKNDQSGREFT